MISICIRAIDDGDRKVPIVLCAPQLLHGERHSRWLGMGQVHSSIEKKTQVIIRKKNKSKNEKLEKHCLRLCK